MEYLPEDIIINLSDYLSASDLRALSETCRALYRYSTYIDFFLKCKSNDSLSLLFLHIEALIRMPFGIVFCNETDPCGLRYRRIQSSLRSLASLKSPHSPSLLIAASLQQSIHTKHSTTCSARCVPSCLRRRPLRQFAASRCLNSSRSL